MPVLREIHVLTLFPDLFDGFLRESILGKALADGRLAVRLLNFRDFAEGKHRSVDDVPYGGGSGMVLMPGPYVAALESLPAGTRRILLSPQGRPFDQAAAARLAGEERLALCCGRYEGFDERIREHVDEQLSLGDFVLQGGEVAAMAVIEAVVRLLPGVLHNAESPTEESFAQGLLEYPQYTRPREFRGREVPEMLISGHHEQIRRWRRKEALRRTRAQRPELLGRLAATVEDRKLLAELDAEAAAAGARRVRVDVALVHHPVRSRTREVVATSVTNLDIHDVARASRTYGIGAYHLVTPITAQRELVDTVAAHWLEGESGARVPQRADALQLVRTVPTLGDAIEALRRETGAEPLVVATAADPRGRPTVGWAALRERLAGETRPVLLVFGTGWGLADEALDLAELLLEPILGPTDYNHLSVRVAVGVTLDRLLGRGR